jgi:uncharacterized iron-regulated membrane protein
MGSNISRRIVPPLAALLVAVTSASAVAMPVKDYSKNGATGDYSPTVVHKNYSLNGATGDVAPVAPSQPATSPVRIVHVQQSAGFAWSDALIGGASVLLAMLLLAGVTHRIRRQRIGAPNPARPAV